jgi:hypothetical protein
VLGSFRAGETLAGVDNRNRPIRIPIGGVDREPGLGESSLQLATAHWRDGVVALLSKPQISIHLLRPKKTRLAADIDKRLRDAIDVLFRRHLAARAPDERPSAVEIGAPTVETLSEAPDLLLIRYPLELIETDGARDDRAQAFFLFSLPEMRVIRGEFGHPEWASRSEVLTIEPEMYFRLAGRDRLFFIGLHRGGWEDLSGRAVYDLRTGRELLLCY